MTWEASYPRNMMMKAERDITVGARVSFGTVSQTPDRLSGVDVAIELPMPYRYEWWKESARRLDEMMCLLDIPGLIVPSIHATQARITDREFLTWGRQTIRVAEHLGARAITVHPNRQKKGRTDRQFLALEQLR